MAGRRPKPANLRLLEGNPGKRPIKNEPKPPMDMPEPPISLDDYAIEEWNRVALGLNAMGILSFMDLSVFASYCDSYSTWRRSAELLIEIQKQPNGNLLSLVQLSPDGIMLKNPLTDRADKAKADMVKYAAELGMTPVARARMAIEPKKEKSKFDGLLQVKK